MVLHFYLIKIVFNFVNENIIIIILFRVNIIELGQSNITTDKL